MLGVYSTVVTPAETFNSWLLEVPNEPRCILIGVQSNTRVVTMI